LAFTAKAWASIFKESLDLDLESQDLGLCLDGCGLGLLRQVLDNKSAYIIILECAISENKSRGKSRLTWMGSVLECTGLKM